uniref:Uncharacterized protein n=1 Tax=Panagrolaimus davidi TaxID=227884 RepID=A0A914PV19_9BILA
MNSKSNHRYKTKKTQQDRGLSANILGSATDTAAAAAALSARRMPMLLGDGRNRVSGDFNLTSTMPMSAFSSNGYLPAAGTMAAAAASGLHSTAAAATTNFNPNYYGGWGWSS